MDIVFTIKELLVSSGAAWVLWLLFGLSLGSIAVAAERWLAFRSRDADVAALTASLDAQLSKGAIEEAIVTLQGHGAAAARIAAAGLRLREHGLAAVERGMQSATAVERSALEARLAFLGTLGNNAPFVGLFGTVIGVVLAFDQLGQANAAAGQAVSQEVMGAIAEALVATAVGIAVALPAVAGYNYFQRRIARILGDAEALSHLVLAYLGSTRTERRREAA